MRVAIIVSLALLGIASSIPAPDTQEPLDSVAASASPAVEWDLEALPNENATGHLVFETVGSLLQHWPNTRMRNGHNLVPGIVRPGTLLYHGTYKNEVPKVPEWLAMDPEHSYMFCRGPGGAGCWHLTLVASRPLNVLYFDGSSAAKMPGGSLDTQDLTAWGQLNDSWSMRRERQRIDDLCAWGRKYEIDGFVRMEMDFEIMYCDFTDGVEVVSFLNLAGGREMPRGPPGPHLHEHDIPRPDLSGWYPGPHGAPAVASAFTGFQSVLSGSWSNFYPGDQRIELDVSRLVSFYDTATFPSLVDARYGKERWDHRLMGISEADTKTYEQTLDAHLKAAPSRSGIDWRTLIHVIVNRFADRLEILEYALNKTVTNDENTLIRWAKEAQSHTRIMLTPYLLKTVVPPSNATTDLSWAAPAYELCSTAHTAYISSNLAVLATLSDSERLILDGIEQTTEEICRTVTRMWAQGVLAGIDEELIHEDDIDEAKLRQLTKSWAAETQRLMTWLDWSVWVKCKPGCSFEEICYLPTWPFFMGRGKGPGGPRGPGGPSDPNGPKGHGGPGGPKDFKESDRYHQGPPVPDDPDCIRPQPRCVPRFGEGMF
ncbi:hypothetical protein FB107DRAFT_199818 [Schizophyllum commune]